MPKRKAKPARKRTSDGVSRIAGKVLRILQNDKPHDVLVCEFPLGDPKSEKITVADVKALAASCLSQDEVKGKRK